MKMDMEDYDQIERYLNSQMSVEEVVAFEQKIKSDASFAEEVSAHKAVHELIIDQGLIELKQKVKSFKPNPPSNFRNGAIISSLVVIVSTVFFLSYNKTKTESSSTPHEVVVAPSMAETNGNSEITFENPKVNPQNPQTSDDHVELQVDTLALISDLVVVDSTVSISPIATEKETPIASPLPPQPNTKVNAIVAESIKEESPGICILEDLNIKYATFESCRNGPTGKIVINVSSITKGSPPYQFAIRNNGFHASNEFTNLNPGEYKITIKDSKGCIIKIEEPVEVGEKNCSTTTEYSFNPTLEERWQFPIKTNGNGLIKIFDKNGALVFKTTIKNGHPKEWNGRTNNDVELPMGSYTYLLKTDSSLESGFVTIFK